ncbi:uncharacterized protein TRIADDRAFT_51870 [Trichoplax adhaerens]|uniref:RING-type E3 ubiquitin transferase n=1 Tax=Trichoplax adhaerens TaxID=10228 RepID=B3RL42_TRIAD|nr:hypothetical protein TRIADDRAFT_51870 [Trichoplax adhaerens]EDV29484.1 hypothetical protein TRIADDRAFT_51870 [Trichoplax adhaerens]|eukprot:XP_002108686.1 hypothetical protein TRIADDRAFT_51870 [Trichoplax adhaerens]
MSQTSSVQGPRVVDLTDNNSDRASDEYTNESTETESEEDDVSDNQGNRQQEETNQLPQASAEKSNESDGDICSICFEPFSNSGDHRLSCLKCGHLFGFGCISKWLNGKKGNSAKCPQCNALSKKSDIRILFAKSIKVIDTTERDRAVEDWKRERMLRLAAEQHVEQLKLVNKEYERKIAQEDERNVGKHQGQSASSSKGNLYENSPKKAKLMPSGYHYKTTVQISQQGNCRVMAFDVCSANLLVSKPSQNRLFPGFGIVKISSLDVRNPFFLKLHNKDIRDLKFNQSGDNLLLSASLDKTLKITSMSTDNVVQT